MAVDVDVSALELTGSASATLLPVQVQPGASRDAVCGVHDGMLKLRISAPPVEGAANERCLKYLAKEILQVPRSRLSLAGGDHARRKLIAIEGVSPDDIRARLQSLPEPKR